MAYAQGRTFYDADSHVMELPGSQEALLFGQLRAALRSGVNSPSVQARPAAS